MSKEHKYDIAYESCASGRFGSSHWDVMREAIDKAKKYDQIKSSDSNEAMKDLGKIANHIIYEEPDVNYKEAIGSAYSNEYESLRNYILKAQATEQAQNLEITMQNLPPIEDSLETLFKFSYLNEKIDITSARAMKKQIGRALEELAEWKKEINMLADSIINLTEQNAYDGVHVQIGKRLKELSKGE